MGQNSGDQPNDGTQSGRDGQATANSQQDPQAQQGQQPRQGQQTDRSDGTTAQTRGERMAGWFTETLVRGVVAIFGLALLLFALGQLLNADLLEIVTDFLTSSVGVWLVIAFFALLLIIAAGKSWNTYR